MKLTDAIAYLSKEWHVFFAWIETLISHHQAGTLPPAPQPGQSVIITGSAGGNTPPANAGATGAVPPATGVPAALPAGFASAPNENGYVQLTQVEADRAQYLNGSDADYAVWAKQTPHWFAIDDTLTSFTLTDAQKKKLGADIDQANVLAALGGWGDWGFTVAANLPDSAAFSNGDLSPATAGVHLRNIEAALAHQRAHAKAINAGSNPTGAGAVASPGGSGGGQFK